MSHNPPNPELLDTLDTAGFLVMNENRNFGNHTTWIDDFVSRKNNRAFRCIRTIGSVHSFKNASSALYYIKRICFNHWTPTHCGDFFYFFPFSGFNRDFNRQRLIL